MLANFSYPQPPLPYAPLVPTVTDIQEQRRRKERVSVFLDEEFVEHLERVTRSEDDLPDGEAE